MEQVTWYVGIDWGSESHAVCVVDAAGHRREERRVDHTADAVQACLDWIMTFTGATPAQIAVAIETPRGAVVDACLARGLLVFAVNPKQLFRSRDRHTVAGAKDDRRDAWVLADSLRTDPAAFQHVHGEDPIVVQLRELSRAEEDLDAEFRRLANQLRSQVHRLVPEVLALCPGADEPWFWALLQIAPTSAAQRRLTRARVDHLLRAHRIRRWRGADVVARLQAPLFPHPRRSPPGTRTARSCPPCPTTGHAACARIVGSAAARSEVPCPPAPPPPCRPTRPESGCAGSSVDAPRTSASQCTLRDGRGGRPAPAPGARAPCAACAVARRAPRPPSGDDPTRTPPRRTGCGAPC